MKYFFFSFQNARGLINLELAKRKSRVSSFNCALFDATSSRSLTKIGRPDSIPRIEDLGSSAEEKYFPMHSTGEL